MCNDYRLMVELASVIEEFENLKIKICFPEGRPNIEPREDIRITDTAPIVRTVEGERGVGDLVQRRMGCPPRPACPFIAESRREVKVPHQQSPAAFCRRRAPALRLPHAQTASSQAAAIAKTQGRRSQEGAGRTMALRRS